jgi:hypothetical protein
MVSVQQLFAKPPAPPSAGTIIRWWEARRLHYDLLVLGTIVLVSIVKIWIPWSSADLYGGARLTLTFWQSILLQVLLVLLPANIWYTGGWLTELLLRKVFRVPAGAFGPWALGIGMAFSILFTGLISFIYL